MRVPFVAQEMLKKCDLSQSEFIQAQREVDYIFTNYFRLFWDVKSWTETYWQGYKIYKYPSDIVAYQEIIFEKKPDVIIETGTYFGGGALFLANMLDLLGKGRVITVDLRLKDNLPVHDRIVYVEGDCISQDVVNRISDIVSPSDKVMVCLDSRHNKYHVDKEMDLYHKFVSPDQYFIVDDTYLGLLYDIIDPETQKIISPGPREAVIEFIDTHKNFVIDRSREKFLHTQNPYGYLLRTEG